MNLTIPELSLVVLMGVSGSGKSTFARQLFRATEVVSSDTCRGLVSDDENNQAASADAFALMHFIIRKRLAAGRLTVVDATNVQAEPRRALVALAREFHVLPVMIVLQVPESLAQERNRTRADRQFGAHVVRNQEINLRRSLRGLEREGFRQVHLLREPEALAAVTISRQPLWSNRKDLHGPFDLIGDVHGCYDELLALLEKLGYTVDAKAATAVPPAGRQAFFVGDLVDRGPAIPQVLRLVMNMAAAGHALCVPGNHDTKLVRKLRGREVQVAHGLAESLAQLANETPEFRAQAVAYLDGLVSHLVVDDGKLVVAHAGLREDMHGRASATVRSFCLYGDTTGEIDEFGLPVRANWAAEYRGNAMVVYGHTPVPAPEWLNRTINLDTGCVFGGQLTAMRYPEKELVAVPAARVYAEPKRPFLPEAVAPALSAQHENDEFLDLAELTGRRPVQTRLMNQVTIPAEHAAAALELMSRYACNPKWLIYLPPTMSPSETTQEPGLLEHPTEAFAYFRKGGVARVICEEKHMGSRAVIVLGRDEAVIRQRFGLHDAGIGICYTRTGRRFFDDRTMEQGLLQHLHEALTRAQLWEELGSDWFCFDTELMPWSAKAQSLLRDQYGPVGAAGNAYLASAAAILQQALARGQEVGADLAQVHLRQTMLTGYQAACQHYCWPVNSLNDLRLAPFHLLAGEAEVYVGRPHEWHMQTLGKLASELVVATPWRVVDLADPASEAAAIQWWTELTAGGGEGMVVKPMEFIARGRKGILQPAIKCRGAEYLRIIYGPEYLLPEHLERLRQRGVSGKRSLALREFALGIEALERFQRHEPLRRVHECVFGVLALESEPLDPRL
jgi:protein phosphatase